MHAEMKIMTSAEYAAILLLIGSLSLDYCNALRCYECGSPVGGHCSNPLDTKHSEVKEDECQSVVSACMKSKVLVGGKLHIEIDLTHRPNTLD